MVNHVMQFVRDEEGVTALEYGLLAALIAAAIVASTQVLGTQVISTFDGIAGVLASAVASGSGSGSGS